MLAQQSSHQQRTCIFVVIFCFAKTLHFHTMLTIDRPYRDFFQTCPQGRPIVNSQWKLWEKNASSTKLAPTEDLYLRCYILLRKDIAFSYNANVPIGTFFRPVRKDDLLLTHNGNCEKKTKKALHFHTTCGNSVFGDTSYKLAPTDGLKLFAKVWRS